MIDEKQLEHFRERQALSLMDVCHRLVQSQSQNDYNEIVEVWTEDETDIPCGLDQSSGNERRRTADTLLSYDAVLRLTIDDGMSFNEKDKLKITKRFGETLDIPLEYEIASPPQRGASGVRLLIRKITL